MSNFECPIFNKSNQLHISNVKKTNVQYQYTVQIYIEILLSGSVCAYFTSEEKLPFYALADTFDYAWDRGKTNEGILNVEYSISSQLYGAQKLKYDLLINKRNFK